MHSSQISVIIPVYNSANYLPRIVTGLKSVDCKIILVDDGSTDGCSELCDKYARENSNIQVLHQKNSGPSVARENGLKHVTTPWVAFFDADDEVDPQALKQALNSLTETSIDLHVFGFKVKGESLSEDIHMTPKIFPREEIGDYLAIEVIGKKYGNGFLWNKFYKTSLAIKVGFDHDLRMMEDEMFNQRYLKLCRNIECHSEIFYIYNISTGSNSRSRFIPNYFESVNRVFHGFCLLKSEFTPTTSSLDEKYNVDIQRRTTSGLFHVFTSHLFHPSLPQEERKALLNRIVESEAFRLVISNKSLSTEMKIYLWLAKSRSISGLKNAVSTFKNIRKIKNRCALR